MRRILQSGTIFIWLSAGMAALSVLMIAGLVGFILIKGLNAFWPREVVELSLRNGSTVLGEVWGREEIIETTRGQKTFRQRLKIGNRDLWGLDFRGVDEREILSSRFPDSVLVLERRAWGNFIGYARALRHADSLVARGAAQTANTLLSLLDEYKSMHNALVDVQKNDLGEVNDELEEIRLRLRQNLFGVDTSNAEVQREVKELRQKQVSLQEQYKTSEKRLTELQVANEQKRIFLQAANGAIINIPATDVVLAYLPNKLSAAGKSRLFIRRLWAFLSDRPREGNMEGGIFPAIFGTVMMVLLMSVAVSPLGVLTAVYMREYARQGPLLRFIRIMVNNLAGVPSVVMGVFGLAFFIYTIGGTIDRIFYPEALPAPTFGTGGIFWASLTLALLTVPVVIVATEEGLAAVPMNIREGSIALGATKTETLTRIILPAASPGILTGLILAMARAAGEVAPLMMTGVVKLAPDLPLDGRFPFLHLDRKFMHLGFHIYDAGFQSPNVEASVPVVFATTTFLILIILVLNIFAIILRSRLRKHFSVAQL
jgi:phosphate transport system permease protein